MRVTRVKVNGQRSTAVIKGRTPHLVSGAMFRVPTPAGGAATLSKVEFPVPAQPSKILAIGIDDARRAGHRVAPNPQTCLDGSNTTSAHGAAIASGRSKSSRR